MEGIMVSSAATGEEYNLQKKVKRDVAFLKDELSSMNALLEKLADTEVLDPQVREWTNKIREMAYDIADCIDDYMHRLHQDSDNSNGIERFFPKTIKKRFPQRALRPSQVPHLHLLRPIKIVRTGG